MRSSDWSSDVCSSDLEHQRSDGAVDEFDDLAALGFVPGFFHERELAAGEGDVIEGADGGHEQHAGGVEFGRDTTQVVQDDAGFGAGLVGSGDDRLFRGFGLDDFEHGFSAADELGDAGGADDGHDGHAV